MLNFIPTLSAFLLIKLKIYNPEKQIHETKLRAERRDRQISGDTSLSVTDGTSTEKVRI